jgi:hypothetical protein
VHTLVGFGAIMTLTASFRVPKVSHTSRPLPR